MIVRVVFVMKFIIGKKLGMTQIFDDSGVAVPVTLVEAGPCTVTDKKSVEKDGYTAIQLGFEKLKESKITKSKAKKPYRYLREFRTEEDVTVGEEISVAKFEEGEKVRVKGISKGKGFAGVMKRWNFSGAGTSSHGTKHSNRKPGSIGSMFPQKVKKGRKMAGRMGSDSVTLKNAKIVSVDLEKNIMAIKGAIPGKNGGVVVVSGLKHK